MAAKKVAAGAPSEAQQFDAAITVTQASALFDRTPRWMQNLVAAGFIAKPERGRYSIAAVCRGVVAYFEAERDKTSKVASASRATDARTEEIRLRIAERRRELIPMDDARAELAAVVSEVRAEIVGMGARITRDMELRRQIDREADGILQRLAERAEKACGALEAAGGSVAAEPEA